MGPDLTQNFFWKKRPKIVLLLVMIFWGSIPCVFCLYTLLKVVGHYHANVLSISVMVSKKIG